MRRVWKQWIGGGVAALLVIAAALVIYAEKTGGLPGVVFGITPTDSNTAQSTVATDSKPTKDLTKPLGSAENPFVVLEIVSDESYGELGYFISECEPVDLDRLSYYSEMSTIINAQVGITGEQKNNLYFADEEEYKKAVEEKDKGGSLTFIGTPTDAPADTTVVYGYYEMVADGAGYFIQNNTDGTGTVEYAGENVGNIVWHSLNDGTAVSGGAISLLNVGDKYYTAREVDGKAENKLYQVTKYDYVNESLFLTEALGLSVEEAKTYNVVLKTITSTDLNDDYVQNADNSWVSKADVISLTAQSHITGAPDIWNQLEKGGSHTAVAATNFTNCDLNWEVTWAIYQRALDSDNYAAIVMDSVLGKKWETNRTGRVEYYQLDYDGNRLGTVLSGTGSSNNVYKLNVMLRSMNPQLFYNLFVKEDSTKNGRSTIDGTTGVYSETTSGHTYWLPSLFLPSTADGKRIDSLDGWTWDEETCFDANLEKTNLVLGHTYTYSSSLQSSISRSTVNEKMFAAMGGETMSGLKALNYALSDKLNNITSTSTKAGINVLEIEPCDTFTLKARRFYFSVPSLDGDITVTSMTSSEFIGDIDDLNSTYDLIYIGTNAASLTTDITGDGKSQV
jgi:hypothetical protein